MRRALRPLAAVLAALAVAGPARAADVVELKDGKKVEGTLSSVTPAAVVVDVAGKPTTIERDKIKTIQLGDPPKPAPSGFGDAMDALRAARDAAERGSPFEVYLERVATARLAVESFLKEPDAPPARKTALEDALAFYDLALLAWQTRLKTYGYAALAAQPLVAKCPPLKQALDDGAAQAKAAADAATAAAAAAKAAAAKDPKAAPPPAPPPPAPFDPGVFVAEHGLPALWSCAADKLGAVP